MASFSRPSAAPLPDNYFSGGRNITGPDGLAKYLNEMEVYLSAIAMGARFAKTSPGSSAFKVTIAPSPVVCFTAYLFPSNALATFNTEQEINLAVTGVGGQDGATVEANTFYYIYAVNNNNTLGFIASKNIPSLGPIGFTDKKLIGSVLTTPDGKGLEPWTQNGQNFILHGQKIADRAKSKSDADQTSISLELFVPVSAVEAVLNCRCKGAAASFSVAGSSERTPFDHCSDGEEKRIEIPVPATPKSVVRRINPEEHRFSVVTQVLGWVDGLI